LARQRGGHPTGPAHQRGSRARPWVRTRPQECAPVRTPRRARPIGPSRAARRGSCTDGEEERETGENDMRARFGGERKEERAWLAGPAGGLRAK
jgi:hypothetical protein